MRNKERFTFKYSKHTNRKMTSQLLKGTEKVGMKAVASGTIAAALSYFLLKRNTGTELFSFELPESVCDGILVAVEGN
jgi:hypothetical protein